MKKFLIIILLLISSISFGQVQNAKFKALGITKILYFQRADGALDSLITTDVDSVGQYRLQNVANGVLPTDAINLRQLQSHVSGVDSNRFNITNGYVYSYIGGVTVDSFLLDDRYKLISDTTINGNQGIITVNNTSFSTDYKYEFANTDYNLDIDAQYWNGTEWVQNGYSNPVKTTTGFTCTLNEGAGYLQYHAYDTSLSLATCNDDYISDSSYIKTGIRSISGKLAKSDSTGNDGFTSRLRHTHDLAAKQNALTNPVTSPNAGVSGYLNSYSGAETIDSIGVFWLGSNLGIGTTIPKHKLVIVCSLTTNENGFNIVNSDKNKKRDILSQATDTASYSFSFTPLGKPQLTIKNIAGVTIVNLDSLGIFKTIGSAITSQALTFNSTNTTMDFTSGADGTVTMTNNIATLTLSNVADGGFGMIDVLQNGTGGYGITAIAHSGLTVKYMNSCAPTAAYINSAANGLTSIGYKRVGSILKINYCKY